MKAREAILTVLDFESTGAVRGWPDEPWQAGLVELSGGRVTRMDYSRPAVSMALVRMGL